LKGVGIARAAVVALLFAPLAVWAAGLGRLTVLSGLGEPLRAEVEIISLQPGEEDSLTARIASPETFRQAGIDYSPTAAQVRVAIERRNGRAVVRLSTPEPVNDPFVDLMIELQWAAGRLVREYTFLLDPPELRKPSPAVAVAPAPAPAPAAPQPVEAKPLAPVAKPAAQPPAALRAPAAVTRAHEVKKGETLAGIARTHKPEGVSLNQMMVALFRANADAFVGGNINLVRAGRILNVPDRDAAASVDSAAADQMVQAQMAAFAEYRARLAAAAAGAPAGASPGQREVVGRIEQKPQAVPPEAKDRLQLARADEKKADTPSARAAREDDRVATGRALKEAQERIAELEKNVADLRRLLELRNQQLALLEQKAGVKPAAEPTKPAAEAAKPAAEPAKPAAEAARPAAEPAKPAAEAAKPAAEPTKAIAEPAAPAPEPRPAPVAAPAVQPEKAPEAAKPQAEAPKAQVAPKQEAPKAKPKPKAPPPPEPSLLEEFLDPTALAGLAAVVLALAGYAYWKLRRRRQPAREGFAQAMEARTEPAAAAAPAATAAVVGAAQAAVAAQAAATEAEPAAAAEIEEVDPVAEAEVYLAYGRDAQAERILKDALANNPDRVAVHMKLLEIYAHRSDAASFAETALKVKELTGGTGADWEHAAALGRSVEPGNELYGTGEAQPAMEPLAAPAAPSLDLDLSGTGRIPAVSPASTLDFDLGAAPEPASAPEAASAAFSPGGTLIVEEKEETRAAAAPTIDFDLGLEARPAPESPAGIDLDLGQGEAQAAASTEEKSTPLDFDLDLDLGEPAQQKAAEQRAPLGFDLGDAGGAAAASPQAELDAKWQEVATKLDLAKAYEEMGDKEGARELLHEVLKEGDAAQQARAREMLAALG